MDIGDHVRASSAQSPKWTEEDAGAEANLKGAYSTTLQSDMDVQELGTDLGGGFESMLRGLMER